MLDPNKPRTSIVYVELDALLDTRLGTLAKINPEYPIKALDDPRYYSRQIDDFTEICGVGREEFIEAYKKRDAEVARASTMTNIPLILHELVRKLEIDAAETPHLDNVQVELNVWPYVFDAEELDDLETAVQARAGIESMVRSVSIPYKDLTPAFCRSKYSGMFIYNFRDWCEAQLEAFASVQMPQVTVIAPALFHDRVHTVEELDDPNLKREINIHQLSELGMTPLIALSLYPAEHFSIFKWREYIAEMSRAEKDAAEKK